jgi:hypothetical protein
LFFGFLEASDLSFEFVDLVHQLAENTRPFLLFGLVFLLLLLQSQLEVLAALFELSTFLDQRFVLLAPVLDLSVDSCQILPKFSLSDGLLLNFAEEVFSFGEELPVVGLEGGEVEFVDAAQLGWGLLHRNQLQLLPEVTDLAFVVFVVRFHLTELLVFSQ